MSRERNNLKAGVFVVVGLALMFAMIISLANFKSWTTSMQTAEVRFDISDGLKGLKPGSSVTIAHLPAGVVTDVIEPTYDRPEAIVRFEIPSRYKLYENARLELDVPALGSGTKLNIAGFGGEAPTPGFHGKSWLYEPGDPPIAGGIAGSMLAQEFVKRLGIEDQQRAQIQNIIANLDRLSNAIGGDPKPIHETIANVQKLTGTLAADVPVLTEDLKRKLPAITDNTEAITGDVRAMIADVRGKYGAWLTHIDSILVNTKEMVDRGAQAVNTVQAMLDENRAAIKTALDNTADITTRVKTETMEKIHAALDKANAALADANEITHNLKTFLVAQRPILERTIANFRLASDQIKLASIEVRRSPWRLLYTPTDKELETDNIYDAARSFSLAADSLNSTADSLQAVLDRYGSRIAADDPNFKLMLDNLRQTFEKFAQAENKFWEALKTQGR